MDEWRNSMMDGWMGVETLSGVAASSLVLVSAPTVSSEMGSVST